MPQAKKRTPRAKNSPTKWQLQTAKARFSEVVRLARTAGPQVVTKQGKDEVVIVSVEDFKKLKRRSRQPASLVEFLAKSPLAEAHIDFDREPDYPRDIKL